MNIIIAGSGPSISSISPKEILSSNAHVIAVNSIIDWLGGADSWFTLDPSSTNLRIMRNPIAGVEYYAAINDQNPAKKIIPEHVRVLKRINNTAHRGRPTNTPKYWYHRWGCVPGLSEDPSKIHTGNSVYGALGLAYHWKPKNILLLGVDGTNEPKVTNGRPTDYNISHLNLLFSTAVIQLRRQGITVINGSENSKVTCFTRCTPQRGLKWLSTRT